MISKANESQEVALYYPGHLWRHSEWIKSLLLFFDGVGLLVPEYKKQEPEIADPSLAEPLREQGLLHFLVADQAVDHATTGRLYEAVTQLIAAGALDAFAKDTSAFHALSMSRMGFYGDQGLARDLLAKLIDRGLAKKSEDGVSVPMHPSVRYLILVLLAQIIKGHGVQMGFELSPATDRVDIIRALKEVLDLPMLPSTGNVVAFDARTVGVDLSAVPLAEVLDFRKQHLEENLRYVRSVRRFARELSLIPEHDRVEAFADRKAELDDLSADIYRKAKAAWKLPTSFVMGLAGAVWQAASGNLLGALLSASALGLKGPGSAEPQLGAYSYLFKARDRQL